MQINIFAKPINYTEGKHTIAVLSNTESIMFFLIVDTLKIYCFDFLSKEGKVPEKFLDLNKQVDKKSIWKNCKNLTTKSHFATKLCCNILAKRTWCFETF